MKSTMLNFAAVATLGLLGARSTARANIVGEPSPATISSPADVADGSYKLGSSSVYANGQTIFVSGSTTFTDGFKFDISPAAGQIIDNYTITAYSPYQLTVGLTGSIPFGYYIGGFTNNTSGATLATEQYVDAGMLNFVVTNVNDSSTFEFSSPDLNTLAQKWLNGQVANDGIVFSSQAPALKAIFPSTGSGFDSMEVGDDTIPTSHLTTHTNAVPEPETKTLLAGAGAFALAEVLRRKNKAANKSNGPEPT